MTVRDTAERVFAAAPGSTTYHVKVDSANQGTLVVNSTNVLDTSNPQFGEKNLPSRLLMTVQAA